MTFEAFEHKDLKCLKELQPPEWGDLTPRFSYFIESDFCRPVKLLVNNEIVGIGTDILHEDTAWLACIIVHPNHRNKGLGSLITQKLIDIIDKKKFQTIYLDATDLGYPVYKKIGFESETQYSHLKLAQPLSPLELSNSITEFKEKYREQILKLDREVSGENRFATLAPHILSSKVFIHSHQVEGFYMPTLGDGLIIAQNSHAGMELMKYRFQSKSHAVLPLDNKKGMKYLTQNKYVQFRTSCRMRLGKRREVQLNNIYNRISGQLG